MAVWPRNVPVYVEPPPELVQNWCADYDNVLKVTIYGIPFYLRPLTRGDLQRAVRAGGGPTKPATEELLCASAVIWPEYDFSDGTQIASIPTRLTKHLLDFSGMTPDSSKRYFDYWNDRCYDADMRRDLLILGAFKALTFEDLDVMTANRYYKYLASAALLQETQIFTSGLYPEYDPAEFVSMLLCERPALMARMDRAKADRQKIESEGKQQEAEAQLLQMQMERQQKQARSPRPYVAPPPSVC